jgi:protein-disulfide isomerase
LTGADAAVYRSGHRKEGGMLVRKLIAPVSLAALLLATTPACAQQAPPGDVQKQIDALRTQVSAMQKDLDEIKALLAPLRAQQPPKPEDIVLDLGSRPIRGNPAAKLTLVEFTDYQ